MEGVLVVGGSARTGGSATYRPEGTLEQSTGGGLQ